MISLGGGQGLCSGMFITLISASNMHTPPSALTLTMSPIGASVRNCSKLVVYENKNHRGFNNVGYCSITERKVQGWTDHG